MLKSLIVSLLAGVAAFGAVAAESEVKVGFVNGQRVLNEAPQAAKAKKKLEKEFEKRDTDLQKMAKQLQSLQENLEKNGLTMTESERRAKEREFGETNREFQRRQREFREDVSLRQNEEMMALNERVGRAVKQVAEVEKFDLILTEAAFVSPKVDLTEKVIKVLQESKDGSGK